MPCSHAAAQAQHRGSDALLHSRRTRDLLYASLLLAHVPPAFLYGCELRLRHADADAWARTGLIGLLLFLPLGAAALAPLWRCPMAELTAATSAREEVRIARGNGRAYPACPPSLWSRASRVLPLTLPRPPRRGCATWCGPSGCAAAR